MNAYRSHEEMPAIPSEDRIAAYYQPIVAVDTRRIFGYEVLGRERTGDGVRSLGPFFSDERVPVEDQVRVDRLLREQAIAKLGETAEPPFLFLNLKPSWIYRHYHSSGELHTLQLLEKYGISPSKVCIEITEEEFRGSMTELNEVIDEYRAQGCRIAIDDVGSGFSSYDRIAQIQPNLLKVDIHMMKKSASHQGYLGVLRSFSTLAEQIGASLLVEGVETRQDLQRAIQIGARYAQGYLFAPAEAEFRPKDDFAQVIGEELEEHKRKLQASERIWLQKGKRLFMSIAETGTRERLEETEEVRRDGALSNEASERYDEAISRWLPDLDEDCLRVYLCMDNGIQLSSNHSRSPEGTWRIEKDFRGSDWSWRPYFIPHLSHAEPRTESKISTKYADLDTHAWIRTVSLPIGRELVLFLDIVDRTI
ncbi:EAL domain-containing protein [Cohnella algarum]|uniref:EAL domain-containing protein n=1 Tax=Cohnella algarum TaxID=2044859 RepID=UPI001966D4E9|nr:EAL domain-containing protein [Cohnella algarum]MBN2981389.1 EAL domain-containing protein [Cohnella algarum]